MNSPAIWIIALLASVIKAGVAWRFIRIYRAIHCGKKTSEPLFSTSLFLLFLRKKSKGSTSSFFQKPLAGVLHTVLVAALFMMLTEVGVHITGLFFPITSSYFYVAIAEITLYTSIGAILAAFIFMARRLSGRVKRFYSLTPSQRADAYTILSLEIISAVTYILAYYGHYMWHVIHYTMMLFFAVYITYSKHLHIVLALPFMVSNAPRRVFDLTPMPVVSQGLDIMEGEVGEIPTSRMGAREASDFTRGQIFSSFACTQCGRCDQMCPVATVEPTFSPLEVMACIRESSMDGSVIYPEKISAEKAYMCIGCGACVAACPLNINPMDILFQIRRYATLEDGALPKEYSEAAICITRTGLPFQTDKK